MFKSLFVGYIGIYDHDPKQGNKKEKMIFALLRYLRTRKLKSVTDVL